MSGCGTCKHWDTDPEQTPWRFRPVDSDGWVTDTLPDGWPKLGGCQRIQMPIDEQDDPYGAGHPPREQAYVQDGSDYKAWLVTREDFGCVLWEAS